MTYIALSETAAAKQHDLACQYIRAKFDRTEPNEWYVRDMLIKEAREAELDPEFISQLIKDNQC